MNLPSIEKWEAVDKQLIINNKLNSLLLIVGPPGSGKLTNLKKKLKNNLKDEIKEKLLGNKGELLIFCEKDDEVSDEIKNQNNVFIADMININIPIGSGEDDTTWKKHKEDALGDNNSMVIINHFEYNIKDSLTNSMKLDFLEALMLKGKAKIIIISTVHPLTFLDSFYDQQKKTAAGNDKATDDKQGFRFICDF